VRWLRIARRILTWVLVVCLLLALGLFTLLHTPWFKHFARDFAVKQSRNILNGELAIGRMDGNFLSGVVLDDVVLRQGNTTPLRMKHVVVHYSIRQLVRGQAIEIASLDISGLTLAVQRLPSGGLNVGSLLKARPKGRGPRRPIFIRVIRLDGADLTFADPWGPSWMQLPRRVTNLVATLGFESREGRTAFPIQSLRADASQPEFRVRSFAGTVAFEPGGWSVTAGNLQSGKSSIRFDVSFKSSGYDVVANAETFDFPEMSRLVPGLKSMDIPARVVLTMHGPQTALRTALDARSPAGDVASNLVIDSTVPGWKGKGHATLARFDISQWLPTDTRSNITGAADFDLLFGIGRHFPRGTFTFAGPRAVYAGYEATNVRTAGTLVVDRVLVSSAAGIAYGSPFTASGWIDIPSPYGFHLVGEARSMDLRQLPADVPVPHMRSNLSFSYDATGRFERPFLAGSAVFNDSTFLDARVFAGARGTIDTSGDLVTYSAIGNAANLDLNQIGHAFELETLRDPRYGGQVDGAFDLTGSGSTLEALTIDVKGHHVNAALFGGRFADAELDLHIRNDSLQGSGVGVFEQIDAARITGTERARGTLNGRFDLGGAIPGLFDTGFNVDTAVLRGTVSFTDSSVAGFAIQNAVLAGALDTGLATLTTADVTTSAGHGTGKGTVPLSRGSADFSYHLDLTDASQLADVLGAPVQGSGSVDGRAIGPLEDMRVEGKFNAVNVGAAGVSALTASGDYRASGNITTPAEMEFGGKLSATFVSALGWNLGAVTAGGSYARQQLTGEVEAKLPDARVARVSGQMIVHTDHHELHPRSLQIELGKQRWSLDSAAGSPVVAWSATTVSGSDLVFDAGPGTTGRIAISGQIGRASPNGTLSVKVQDVALEDLPPLVPVVAGYRGRLTGTATMSGTLAAPDVAADFKIVNGGVRAFSFESLAGSGTIDNGSIKGEVRLDHRAGVWLTARGTVPMDLFSAAGSKKPVDLAIRSSSIDLGLVEGLTSTVRNVAGTLQLDLTANGPANEPRFSGFVDVQGALFEVPSTGVRYRNGNMHLSLAPEALTLERFHLEDSRGNPVEVTGRAAAQAFRIGDLGFELSATRFDVLHNGLGDVALNGVITVKGTLAAPEVTGDLSLHRATLDADQVLLAAQRPYGVSARASAEDILAAAPNAAIPPVPKLPAFPGVSTMWDNLTMRLRLIATNNLVVHGENMRLSREAVAGVGDINVTFGGDLAIRKAPHDRPEVTGVLQTVRGSYAYQGRRFTIERDGTLRFIGPNSWDPSISITANRTVSGVLVRAVLRGQVSAPELELTSSPPLDVDDILSLLIFNQPVNELAVAQRNELALQAATLASGFVVSPAVSAVGEALGLAFLELEPTGTLGTTSFRLSAGREIWKGLFVTYAREFSAEPYNEFLAEYELTRYLRIRANASDVSGIRSRTQLYRRIERAGIDLIFFFSY
jgi:autotransporter translocation and assembly factor TamB